MKFEAKKIVGTTYELKIIPETAVQNKALMTLRDEGDPEGRIALTYQEIAETKIHPEALFLGLVEDQSLNDYPFRVFATIEIHI